MAKLPVERKLSETFAAAPEARLSLTEDYSRSPSRNATIERDA
jgi:hypothetical protein